MLLMAFPKMNFEFDKVEDCFLWVVIFFLGFLAEFQKVGIAIF